MNNKEIVMLADTEIEKRKFHYSKYTINISNGDVDKIVVKQSFGKKVFKYFTGYKDDEKVKSLCILLPKMRGYNKSFGGTKYMSVFI